MNKRTIYLETSVISYLAARPSRDLMTAACQQATRDWWEGRRSAYILFTSRLVVAEARLGNTQAAKRRLEYLKGIAELQTTREVRDLAQAIISQGALPSKAEADALHIAHAAIHRMDLLLTWNCRHIDNPVMKPAVRSVCAMVGCMCPEICTPLEMLEATDDEE